MMLEDWYCMTVFGYKLLSLKGNLDANTTTAIEV